MLASKEQRKEKDVELTLPKIIVFFLGCWGVKYLLDMENGVLGGLIFSLITTSLWVLLMRYSNK